MDDNNLTLFYMKEYYEIANKLIANEFEKTRILIALGNAVAKLNSVQSDKEYSIKDFYKGE